MNNDTREAVASAAAILGSLYLHDPRTDEGRRMVDGLAGMDFAEEWPYGSEGELARAEALIREGANGVQEELSTEYKRQFVGPGHFEAPAWGSVYLDHDETIFGVSNLKLCQWMRKNGIELHESDSREPVDHVGKMLVLLSWLAESKPELEGEYLAEHFMPWVLRYLDLLEESAIQPFYTGLAILTRETLSGIVAALDVAVVEKQLFH